MSLLSRIPSVNDTYFQHKLLTKIHGAPSYDSLQNLLIELKANAGSVPTTLGGGHHGHLSLIVSPERYATLAHTIPWVNPVPRETGCIHPSWRRLERRDRDI